MFYVTPREDFSNLRAGSSYKVLDTMFINSQLKLLTHDDDMDLCLIPAEKFKLVDASLTDKDLSSSSDKASSSDLPKFPAKGSKRPNK